MSTFRKGDKVSVTGVVRRDSDHGWVMVDIAVGDDEYGTPIAIDKTHVSIVEPALKRGDEVKVKASTDWIDALVRGVDLDEVWVELGNGESFITPLSTVRRVERPQEIAEAA